MSQGNVHRLTILGREIAFRPGADMERIQATIDLLEERYAEQGYPADVPCPWAGG